MNFPSYIRLVVYFVASLIVTIDCFAQNIRYQQAVRGGFTMAANGLILTSTTTNLPNTAGATTFSSKADLILPANSRIEKAILYVEGYALTLTSAKFKVPGGNFITINSTSPYFKGVATASGYSILAADVTALMPVNGYVSTNTTGGEATGKGSYAVGDLQPFDSNNNGYGWALYVVYSNPNSKLRFITIAEQASNLSSANSIILNQVLTPATGTVNAVVALTGSWGDRTSLSTPYDDYARLGVTGGTLANLADPETGSTNDVLNSTIAIASNNNVTNDGGPAFTGSFKARSPYNGFPSGYSAMYYDADLLNASGILPNSTSPISINFQQSTPVTSVDALGAGAYGISIDVATACLTKSVNPAAISPGQIATYTFTITNNLPGAINLTGLGFTDNIPAGLVIASPANATISGGSGGALTANPGSGVITLSGLNLNSTQSAIITVCITNRPGFDLSDCSTLPADYTNNFTNLVNFSSNLANCTNPVCLEINKVLGSLSIQAEAEQINGAIQLQWQLNRDYDADSYIIERQWKNQGFYPIQKLDKSSISGNYIDKDGTEDAFYRIGLIKNNQVISYSKTLKANSVKSFEQIFSFNSGQLCVIGGIDPSKLVKAVRVYSVSGNLLKEEVLNNPIENGRFEFDMSDLPSGVLVLEVQYEDKSMHIKLIKN